MRDIKRYRVGTSEVAEHFDGSHVYRVIKEKTGAFWYSIDGKLNVGGKIPRHAQDLVDSLKEVILDEDDAIEEAKRRG